jgi:coenzyme F420 hydrogenase subunit beta
MWRRPHDVVDVAELQLCTGCGACAYFEPQAITMVDRPGHGLRPQVVDTPEGRAAAVRALAVCPGAELRREPEDLPEGLLPELLAGWGPVLEVWEGHAADPELRRAASSGGAASALALACIEKLGMHGVLHIAAQPQAPHLNRTRLSRTREELLGATGSRYAPASPCDGLGLVENAPGPCVMIGKPCDVAAALKARRLRPALDRQLGLTIGIFCAGTPSTDATLALMDKLGVADPARATDVRYRGNGWPGEFSVAFSAPASEGAQSARKVSCSYAESWGFLQAFRPWRCALCPDHTGEFADIAVGDPWYRQIPADALGSSLIVLRSARGARLFRAALAAGYLVAERVPADLLPASQPQLLRTRGALFGRLWTSRLLGAAAPRLTGFATWRFFLSELDFAAKLRSFTGTARRVFRRGLLRRVRFN